MWIIDILTKYINTDNINKMPDIFVTTGLLNVLWLSFSQRLVKVRQTLMSGLIEKT